MLIAAFGDEQTFDGCDRVGDTKISLLRQLLGIQARA